MCKIYVYIDYTYVFTYTRVNKVIQRRSVFNDEITLRTKTIKALGGNKVGRLWNAPAVFFEAYIYSGK